MFVTSSAKILCSKEDFNNNKMPIPTSLKQWSITIPLQTDYTAPPFTKKEPYNMTHMTSLMQ